MLMVFGFWFWSLLSAMRHVWLSWTPQRQTHKMCQARSKIFRSPDPEPTPSLLDAKGTQWHHNKSEAVPTKQLNNQSCTPPITTTLPCISKTRHLVIKTSSLPALEEGVVSKKAFLVIVMGLEEIQGRLRNNYMRRCWSKALFTSAQCCNITWQEHHR